MGSTGFIQWFETCNVKNKSLSHSTEYSLRLKKQKQINLCLWLPQLRLSYILSFRKLKIAKFNFKRQVLSILLIIKSPWPLKKSSNKKTPGNHWACKLSFLMLKWILIGHKRKGRGIKENLRVYMTYTYMQQSHHQRLSSSTVKDWWGQGHHNELDYILN